LKKVEIQFEGKEGKDHWILARECCLGGTEITVGGSNWKRCRNDAYISNCPYRYRDFYFSLCIYIRIFLGWRGLFVDKNRFEVPGRDDHFGVDEHMLNFLYIICVCLCIQTSLYMHIYV